MIDFKVICDVLRVWLILSLLGFLLKLKYFCNLDKFTLSLPSMLHWGGLCKSVYPMTVSTFLWPGAIAFERETKKETWIVQKKWHHKLVQNLPFEIECLNFNILFLSSGMSCESGWELDPLNLSFKPWDVHFWNLGL